MPIANGTETEQKAFRSLEPQTDTVAVNVATMGADGTIGKINPLLLPISTPTQEAIDNLALSIDENTATKTLTNEDVNSLIRSNGIVKQYYLVPSNLNDPIEIGSSIIVKQSNIGTVNIIPDIGVTLEYPSAQSNEILSRYDAVELVKEKINTWGVYGSLKASGNSTAFQTMLSTSMVTPTTLYWPKIYKSSDWPELTTTKAYFTLYSTDHDSGTGGIWWAECDDVYYTNLVERGKITITGTQIETPWLMKIPTSESGLSTDTIFLYYHRFDGTTGQTTNLMTTVGGVLHTATWTHRGEPIVAGVGDNHTGYLMVYKRGVNDYIGRSLLKGGPGGDGSRVVSTNGLTFTIQERRALFPSFNGGTVNDGGWVAFKRGTILYGFIMYQVSGNTSLALVTLDNNYKPVTFIKNILTPESKPEIYIEGDKAFICCRDEITRTKYFVIEYDLTELD